MQTKLTLRIEDELITKAKREARRRGKSLSRIVAEYFNYISSDEEPEGLNLPQNVKSLYGSLAGENIDESDYQQGIQLLVHGCDE